MSISLPRKNVLLFIIGILLVAYYWFVAHYEMTQIVSGVQNLNTASAITLAYFLIPYVTFVIVSSLSYTERLAQKIARKILEVE